MPSRPGSASTPPLVVILAVGLTGRLLPHAPRLRALADRGWHRPLAEVQPAVTSTAQATFLTGKTPAEHGIVANGWLFRDTREVRLWQQANSLLRAEPVYATARRRAERQGRTFRAAKLFWWFNQGADVAVSVTPKPFYACDGNKAFAIDGQPRETVRRLESDLGPFPFPSFWGPRAGLPATRWIARSAASVIDGNTIPGGPPDLTLVYLPHLDYDPQRHGPSACDMPRLVSDLDAASAPLLDACERTGARVWVLSEYGHTDATRPVPLNRILRREGWLSVRPGPFGEILDTFDSRALAVCDHQHAHIYVKHPADVPRVADRVAAEPGVAAVYAGEPRAALGLDCDRSGEIVAVAEPGAWFAYPFWLDDAHAPDYARTVDIHRKPGFDPCEMFTDPALRFPALRVARRLARKKLGFRTRFDLIPLDPSIVRGTHGRPADHDPDRPLWIADGPPPSAPGAVPMTSVRDAILHALDLPGEG